VLTLACRVFSVQRFARCAGSLCFSRQVAQSQTRHFQWLKQGSLHPPVAAMLGCTDELKKLDKPVL